MARISLTALKRPTTQPSGEFQFQRQPIQLFRGSSGRRTSTPFSLPKTSKLDTVNLTGLKKFFAPAPKVRIRDIVRETPGAFRSVARDIAQWTARNIASAGVTLSQAVPGVKAPHTLDVSPGFTKIFGTDQIKSVSLRIAEAETKVKQWGESEPESSNFGKLAKNFPTELAFVGILADVGLDLTGFGGSKKGVTLAIKEANNLGDATRVLTRLRVEDDLVKQFAPEVVNIKNQKQATKLLTHIADVQKTTTRTGKVSLKQLKPVTKAADEIKPVRKIDVPVAKVTREITPDVRKTITKELEPLAIEARKYKSAEEFVGKQPTIEKAIDMVGEEKSIVKITKNKGEGLFSGLGFEQQPNKNFWKRGDTYAHFNIVDKTWHIDGVVPEIKTKSQLTDIWNKANIKDVSDPLIQEAKKYKSAEEFVKAQDKIYRAGELRDGKKSLKGDYFATTKEYAQTYKDRGAIKEYIISKDAKVLDTNDIPKSLRIEPFGELTAKDVVKKGGVGGVQNDIYKYAEKNGYDAVRYSDTETVVINRDVLKTKSQLTDIWNKAKSTKPVITKPIKETRNLPAVIVGDTFTLGTGKAIQPTRKELRGGLKAEIKATKKEVKAAEIAEKKAQKLEVKEKKIRSDAIDNVDRYHGNTKVIIDKLEKKHLSDEDIANIVLEDGTKLVDTVKVKRNKDGSLATYITKDEIKKVETDYTDELPLKWKKANKINDVKETIFNVARGIELPQVYFERKGLAFMYDDIVSAGRGAEIQRVDFIDRFKEAGLFKEGAFTKEGGWITAPRFNLSSKEADNIGKYYLNRQGKGYNVRLADLSPKEKKFVKLFDSIIAETEPRFFEVSRKVGKVPSKVDDYAPIMTREDIKLADTQGSQEWLFRKHPSFFSLKERTKEVPTQLYETDYRKVASRWISGITDFLNYSETDQHLKYLIDSDQFKNLITGKDYELMHGWLKSITTPDLPVTVAGKAAADISKFARKTAAMGSLGLNYSSVIKQALTQIPLAIVAKSRPKFKSQYAKAFDIDVSKLPSITKRSGDIAIADLQGKVGRVFTGALTRFDRKNAQVALNGLLDKNYKKFLKEGIEITPEVRGLIEKRSQDAIDLWFGGFFKGQRPEFFRKEVGNFFLMFLYPLTSQLNGFFQHVLKAKGMAKPKAIAEVMAAATVIAYAEQAIEKLSFQWSDEKEMAKDVTQSLLGNIPMVSQVAFALMSEQEASPSPVIGNVNTIIRNLNKSKDTGEWERTFFAVSEALGLPKQLRRIREGMEIIEEGGIRDKKGKMLAVVSDTDEVMRSILRGKYGSIAAKDWIRNIGVAAENRRWFTEEVEFLQNAGPNKSYGRKAWIYDGWEAPKQEEFRNYLSEGQQKKLDKALEELPDKREIWEDVSGKDERGFINTIWVNAKALGVDPVTAFNRWFTGQKIRRVDNGTIIVERMSLEESQAIREERGATDELRLDHTIPLQLGGSNTKSNLRLVPIDDWKRYTKEENRIGRLLRNGEITKKEAQQMIKDFKEGVVSSIDTTKKIMTDEELRALFAN